MKQKFLRFFLLAAVSMSLSSCAIINTILSIPGALLKSGALPVQMADNTKPAPVLKPTPHRSPLGEELDSVNLPVVRNGYNRVGRF